MRHLPIFILLAAATALAGCASSKSGDVYTRDQARTVHTVKMGVVESVRTVKLEGTRTPIGAATGAVVGGVAGSAIGDGRGQTIATVLGAVAGGVAGAAAEEGLTRKDGVEITVRLDNGTMIAVVQEGSAAAFRPGDRVRVLESGGVTRVTH